MSDLRFLVSADQLFRVAPYGTGWQWMCITDDCTDVSHYVDYETPGAARLDALAHLRSRHGLVPEGGGRR